MAKVKDKRNAILEAAMRVFAISGFSKASIQDIADEAGIGKGTIYEYFKSKDELFVSSFEGEANKYVAEMARIAGSDGLFADKLSKITAFVYHLHAKNGKSIKMVTHESIGYLKDSYKNDFLNLFCRIREKNTATFALLLRQGMDEGVVRGIDIDLAARTILDMIFFSAASSEGFSQEPMSAEDMAVRTDLVVDLIMNGIALK